MGINDKTQVRAKSLAFGGEFVCDPLDQERGKKVFVRYICPGETAEVTITEERANLNRGTLNRLIESSAKRVLPRCKLFSECGGCDLQHMDAVEQRRLKCEMVSDMLARHAGITTPPLKLLGAELPFFNYRNRIVLHCGGDGVIGFYRPESRAPVPVDYCHISEEVLNSKLPLIQSHSKIITAYAGRLFLENYSGKISLLIDLLETSSAEEFVSLEICGFLATQFDYFQVRQRKKIVYANDAKIPIGHFAQVNTAANFILIQKVISLFKQIPVTDLYAGAGNFSIPLARNGLQVTAVESDPALVQQGQERVIRENLSIKFECSSVEAFCRRNALANQVLLDPPRSGAKNILKYFEPNKVSRIIYVSCSLPDLARDLKQLLAQGYRLLGLWAVDMFPQTHHIELICELE